MSNVKNFAMSEFRHAGWCDENGNFEDEMQGAICHHVLELLSVFGAEGHSGSSAPYTINLFKRLAMFEPITPLTGEDSEWVDVSGYGSDVTYQNKRNSAVFKNGKDGQAYWIDGRVFWEWYKDEDGEMSKVYFTSRDSRVDVNFPWTKPEPEYVFSPTDEFPNEVL